MGAREDRGTPPCCPLRWAVAGLCRGALEERGVGEVAEEGGVLGEVAEDEGVVVVEEEEEEGEVVVEGEWVG